MRVNYGVGAESICKIQSVRNTVMLTWGNAGFTVTNKRTGKSVGLWYSSIADPVLNMKGDAKTKSEILEKRTEAYIRELMDATDALKQPVTPLDISRMLVGEAFITYESGAPAVFWFEIKVNDWTKRELYVTPSLAPSFINEERKGVPGVLGHDEGWSAYLTNNPPHVHDATDKEAVSTIKAILNLQVTYTPNDVSAPFAIAVLEPGGLRWIERGMCKSSPKQEKPKSEKTK